jgi:hypothetical protein
MSEKAIGRVVGVYISTLIEVFIDALEHDRLEGFKGSKVVGYNVKPEEGVIEFMVADDVPKAVEIARKVALEVMEELELELELAMEEEGGMEA